MRKLDMNGLQAHLDDGGQLSHQNGLDLLRELRDFAEQAVNDLNQAHDELLKVQGIKEVANRDWPAWTPQANTIRWAERIVGKRLAKTALWTEFPSSPIATVSCSQCGQSFGFGNEGLSHCDQHRGRHAYKVKSEK